MNNYLIPANTKKSQYILGLFTGSELFMFAIGCIISLFLIICFASSNIFLLILMLMPAMVTAFLVMPVPHYHNVLQLLTNIINFYSNRRRYYWRGWCVSERFNPNDK